MHEEMEDDVRQLLTVMGRGKLRNFFFKLEIRKYFYFDEEIEEILFRIKRSLEKTPKCVEEGFVPKHLTTVSILKLIFCKISSF